jgi:hypothetical protein
MRTFELRVYKLRTKETLDFYMNQIYPRHLSSFPLFGAQWSPPSPPPYRGPSRADVLRGNR